MAELSLKLVNLSWSSSVGGFVFGPVSAVAEQDSFIALVGPNGSGKSTLLNLVSGLLHSESGQICYSGTEWEKWSARMRGRHIAFLSQEPEKPFGFSVRDYIALGRFPHLGPFRRLGAADRRGIASEMEAWGLKTMEDRSVSTLSGGEFQKVRLARALVQEPKILLMDEPGNHLDLASRMDILHRLKKEAGKGKSVIAVLHDINDALLYADRVWLLSKGKLHLSGLPSRVLSPETLNAVYGVSLTTFKNSEGVTMLGSPSINRSSPD